MFHEYFDYSPSGDLIWKVRVNPRSKVGEPAGFYCQNGYFYISLNSKKCKRARAIWEMHNGAIPDGMVVDHINRIRTDDRIENLRLATVSDNLYNTKKRENTKSAYKGVKKHMKHLSYSARTSEKGKEIYLGNFKEEADAAQAYNFYAYKTKNKFVTMNASHEGIEWL